MEKLIGWLMNVYRASPFHNAFFGGILAKGLSLITRFRQMQHIVHNVGGVKFNLDLSEVIDSSLYFSGTFEPKVEKIINKFVRAGMSVIDIGANIGYHTFRMASLASPGGMVFAIEPTLSAYTKLVRNSELNPEIDNIRFFKIGLSEDDMGEQTVTFRSSYRLDGSCELMEEKVTLVKLDTLVAERKIDRVDFIKLDVDGFEGQVLIGSLETLKRFLPTLIVEITPSEMIKNGQQPAEIIKILTDIGYTFFNEDQELIHDLTKHCEQLPLNFSTMILAIPRHKTRQITP